MIKAPIGELIEPKPERPETTLTLLDAVRKPTSTVSNYYFTDSIRGHFEAILESVITGRGQGFWIQAEYGAGKTHFLAALTCLLSRNDLALWDKVQDAEIRNYGRRLQSTRLFPVLVNLRGESDAPGVAVGRNLLQILEERISDALEDPERKLRDEIAVTADDEILQWFDTRPASLKNAIDTYVREKTQSSPEEYRHKAGANRLVKLVRAYCREHGIRPDITVSARERFAHIYRQLQQAGYQGMLIVIDEFAFWQDRRPVGSPEYAHDEDVLETLAFVLPKDYGLTIYTIVASQKSAPTKLQGRQIGDRFYEMRLLEAQRDYDLVVSWRVRNLIPERLPEVNQYYDLYADCFEFMRGISREFFQAIFPFQPRCFEALRHITARGLPTARAGINALYDIVTEPSLKSRDALLMMSDLLASASLQEDLRNEPHRAAYKAYGTALDGMENLDFSPDDRQIAERALKTLFLWHLAYADAPRPLSEQDLAEATLTPSTFMRNRDIIALILKRLEVQQVKYSKDEGAFFVVTEKAEGPPQIFAAFKTRITDPYRIEREWERTLLLTSSEAGGEVSLFGDLPAGESKPWKAQHNKIEYAGEVLVASAWKPEYGEILEDDVHFRVVLLTKRAQIAVEDITDRRVAVCVPEDLSEPAKDAARDYLALQELEKDYKTRVGSDAEAVREWIRAKRPEFIRDLFSKQQSAYRAGRIQTKNQLSLDPKAIFLSATNEARISQIASAVLADAYVPPLNPATFKTVLKSNDAGKIFTGLVLGETASAARSAVDNFAVGLELAQPANPRKFAPEHCRVFEYLRTRLEEQDGDVPTWTIYRDLGKDPYGLPAQLITLYLLCFVRYGQAGPEARGAELHLKPDHTIELPSGAKPPQGRLTASTVAEMEWKAGLDRHFSALTYSAEVSWGDVLPFARMLRTDLKATTDPAEIHAQEQRLLLELKTLEASVKQTQSNLELLAKRLGEKVDKEHRSLLSRLGAVVQDTESYVVLHQHIRDQNYADAQVFETDLVSYRKLEMLSSATAEILDAKTYLEAIPPEIPDEDMMADRISILGQLTLANLTGNPTLWPGIKGSYNGLKARYRSVYQIHHREYYKRVNDLRQQLDKVAHDLDALRRLNGIRELGEPVGQDLAARHQTLLKNLRTCTITDVNAVTVDANPLCSVPTCALPLTEQPPAAEVETLVKDTKAALQKQLQRLSQAAIQQILAQSGEDRVSKFIKILRASDLSSLVQAMDDNLANFIRNLLREANIKTETSTVLQQVAEKYPAVEDGQVDQVVQEFRKLLVEAFQAAKQKSPGKTIRISLK